MKNAVLENFAIFTGKLSATFFKTDSKQVFSSENCEIFKKSYFEEYLLLY